MSQLMQTLANAPTAIGATIAGSPALARGLAAAPILAGGSLAMPLAALALDNDRAPQVVQTAAHFGIGAAAGAATGAVLPAIAGDGATRGRGAAVGAAAGVLATLAADVGWFRLLSGEWPGPSELIAVL